MLKKIKRRIGRYCMQWIPQSRLREKRVAVIFSILNRSGWRLENCLSSLQTQTFPQENTDIILVDCGSEETHLTAIQNACKRFGCRLFTFVTPAETFNRSATLNAGIKATGTDTDYVLTTDIDMIFQSNFLEQLVRAHVYFDPALVKCPRRNSLPEHLVTLESFDYDRDYFRIIETCTRSSSPGSCLSAPRDWWFKIGGFDERFRFWGYEDLDVVKRAELDGLIQVGISDCTSFVHQYHVSVPDTVKEMAEAEKQRRQDMIDEAIHLLESSMSVARNPNGWGLSALESVI